MLMGTALFFVVVALLGLIPFPLPGPMYPEWQMEKRRVRAEAAARDAGMDDELTQSTGRHAAEPRKPRPRGPGRHAAEPRKPRPRGPGRHAAEPRKPRPRGPGRHAK